jgi:hypothetical protein
VNDTFGSLRGLWATARATFSLYRDRGAEDLLRQPTQPVHSLNPLVQITDAPVQETRA